MPSIIPGYEYDIFISYRQKDNKHDGWVTQFVENLKDELESTFKEEVSVYFDINPHDGLLETHDVNESLKKKLNSLIFMPVISRTYCDPRSFAWEHEFKAFITQASKDRFGLKVALQNGNVASRVLPIRINDLDAADTKICEDSLGSVLRPVDFIYKEAGVNRPLRWNEETPHNNLNRTLFRNQINKVALSVKDLIGGLIIASKKEKIIKEPVPEPLVTKTKEKKELVEKKKGVTKKYARRQLKSVGKIIIISAATICLFLAAFFYLRHVSKTNWVYREALPEIEQLINKHKIIEAYTLAKEARKFVPSDKKLKELSSLVASKITIISDPPGAAVFIRNYKDSIEEWQRIGITPIHSVEMAGSKFYLTRLYYQIKLEKPEYENNLTVFSTGGDTVYRKLMQQGTIPEGMVYVDKYWDQLTNILVDIPFFMDRYEVTNLQYKKFIDDGGYKNPGFWNYKFIYEGKEITRENAMKLFVDRTGRPGPATWQAGDYADGEDLLPVCGVSWYEADAYAAYAGKSLPTADHWDSGTGWYLHDGSFTPLVSSLSNFGSKQAKPVGSKDNITFFGAFDMAGNVREWVSSESDIGHVTCGGGWNDYTYRYGPWGQLPSLDRTAENGFRCVKYITPEKIPASAYRRIDFSPERDLLSEKPADDKIFSIYKNMFFYDPINLNEKSELYDDSNKDWTIQKVSFTAAYDNEIVYAYLYLPKNASPPYQTLVFFPGTGAQNEKDLVDNQQTNWFLDYILKSGRAVLYPVYTGTFERMGDPVGGGRNYSEYTKKCILDFRRSVDYLMTRRDIDTARIGYYGHSWGGRLGAIIPAVETRLKISILILGGLAGNKDYPETDNINYVTRIKIPVLMLNGKYDYAFNYEKSVLPFYKLLGTPIQDKKVVMYETEHYIPKDQMIKEVLDWLDLYFGPVNLARRE